MSANADTGLTEEEYLRLERAAQTKSEYIDGQMYSMSGASFVHGLITGNLTAELGQRLRDKLCVVIPNDLRVRITRRRFYTYPDVVVVCGVPSFTDDEQDTLLNPTVLIEVLSPSTEKRDRDFKLRHYRKIESLHEYVLVSQSEPLVQSYRRQPSGDWLLSEWEGLDGCCKIESIGAEVPLNEIYRQVTFEPGDVV
jgi:Uma2 family endonuclease